MPTQAPTRPRRAAPLPAPAAAQQPQPRPEAVKLAADLCEEYGSLTRFAETVGAKYAAVYRSIYPERFTRQRRAAYTLEALRSLADRNPAGALADDLTPELREQLRAAYAARFTRYTDLTSAHPAIAFRWLSAFFLGEGTGRITGKVRALAAVLNVKLPEAPAAA